MQISATSESITTAQPIKRSPHVIVGESEPALDIFGNRSSAAEIPSQKDLPTIKLLISNAKAFSARRAAATAFNYPSTNSCSAVSVLQILLTPVEFDEGVRMAGGPAAAEFVGGGRRHSIAREREKERARAKEEAERRFREAEASFREAIENLQKQQDAHNHPLCVHPDSCVANAIGNLCQSFLLAYGVRVGIGILLRAFKLAKRQSYRDILDLKLLVSEKDLIVREEACRIGLLFGGFTGSFHAIRCLLRKLRGKETPLNGFLAGSVAGLSVLSLDDPSRRRTLALYLLARLAQCAYNSAKAKNRFHFWGSHWRHGDSLLFAISSAQVMYSFIMRPETLPKAYRDFIAKTGPVAEPVYRAVRESCRGGPIDLVALSTYLSSRMGFQSLKLDPHAGIIPCSVIHPNSALCLAHNANATYSTFRKTFPLYFSLTFVPYVILHLQKFMESPIRTCWTALKGAVRSTSFLSAFVGLFQAVICLHRKVAIRDHKLVYWFAGFIAALSVLLEKKSRRSELSLYVLPRAADSFWYILVNRHLLPNVKNAEVVLFSLCMGGIMYYLEYEPDTMAPFLRGLIRRFLASRLTTADPPPKLGASYSYVNTLNSGHALSSQDKQSKTSGNSVKKEEQLNLEAFQGL